MKKNNLILYIFFFSLIILNIFWMMYLRILPFIDLPFHLAAATIYRNFSSFSYADFYSIPSLIKSNIFHLFFTSARIFPSVEFANKIYYCIYVILFPVSVLLLIKKAGGNLWFSLLSFFLIYNHNVYWGFTGYTLSVPVFLIYIYFLTEYHEKKKNIYIIVLALMLLFIFSMHFQTAIFGLLVLFAFMFFNDSKKLTVALKTILISLPVLIFMFYAYSSDSSGNNEGLFTYLLKYYSKDFFASLPERGKNLFVIDNFYFFEGAAGGIYATMISLVILFPLVTKYKYVKEELFKLFNSGENKNYYYLLIVISLLCFLFLPDDIPGQNIIYQRFTVFIYLFIIIIAGVIYKEKTFRFYYKAIFITSCLIYFVVLSSYFLAFESEINCFTKEIFPDETKGKVLAGIIIDNVFRGRPVYIHFPMYYTVWKNGITAGLVDYRFGVIKRKADKDKLPVYSEWLDKDFVYNGEYKNVSYILARDMSEIKIKNYNMVGKCGEWRLFNIK